MFKSLFNKNNGPDTVVAPLTGEVIALEDVPDEVFSKKMMGDGIAIKPTEKEVLSPINGEVIDVFETKHAISLRSKTGAEILIHMGLETVNLKGEGFDINVSAGDKIKQGDSLAIYDIDKIKEAGYNTITPLIVTNSDSITIGDKTNVSTVVSGQDQLFEISK